MNYTVFAHYSYVLRYILISLFDISLFLCSSVLTDLPTVGEV